MWHHLVIGIFPKKPCGTIVRTQDELPALGRSSISASAALCNWPGLNQSGPHSFLVDERKHNSFNQTDVSPTDVRPPSPTKDLHRSREGVDFETEEPPGVSKLAHEPQALK